MPDVGTARPPLQKAAEFLEKLDRAGDPRRIETADGFAVWRQWGSGPALLFIHGGAGSWKHFARQIEHFSRDYRVIAVDMPGFGDAHGQARRMEAETIAGILAAGIDELLGSEPFYIAAFSFGAVIGGVLAASMPSRVAGLTLVGAVGLGVPRKRVELTSWRSLGEIEAQRDAHRGNLAALMIFDPERIDDVALAIQESNAARSQLDTRHVVRNEPLATLFLEDDVPIAGIWGERDQIAAPDFGGIRAWFENRDAQAPFILVPGAGHWVQYEDPAAFNAALRQCHASFQARGPRT